MANYQRNHASSGRVYHRSAKPRKGGARTFGESADWSDYSGCEALYTNRLTDLLKCLRPMQWVKNLLLLAAPFFAYFDRSQVGGVFQRMLKENPVALQETLGLAIVSFVLLSAASYVINDLCDVAGDRAHPVKQMRPIAARKVSLSAAILLATGCFAGGMSLAAWLGFSHGHRSFFYVCIAYSVLQFLYTFVARRIPDCGVILLAIGFILRAVAGACIVEVTVSAWLILCVFFGAYFVALCKRRSLYFIKGFSATSTIEPRILDFQIGIVASVTIACYALYTLTERTIVCFGTDRLIYTLPLVLLGLFRYLRLTYQEQRAGIPEVLFLRDPLLLVTGMLWLLACGLILSSVA